MKEMIWEARKVNREKYEQDLLTRIKTLNTEKKAPQTDIKLNFRKPKHRTSQHHKTNANARKQNECSVIRENHD